MKREQAKEILNRLKEMHPNAGCELNYNTPFELLVAVILSAQCTDIRVNQITKNLFKIYNTPSDFANLTLDELKPHIYSCGFFNNKGANIINASKMIIEKFDGVVPKTMEELLKLPGVGRKTASVILSVAFDVPAMPVDTHVFRTSKRIGFSNGNNVDEVERDLKKIFLKEDWNMVHHTLIFHGRYICKARNPQCDKCKLSDLCKYHLSLNKQQKV
ncbi:MAG TPA: endonuclease III [Clostridiales bacterium]|nr:endonuclease III [Clostridiales bacterium]